MLFDLGDVVSLTPHWESNFCHVVYADKDTAEQVFQTLMQHDERKRIVDEIRKELIQYGVPEIAAPRSNFYVRWANGIQSAGKKRDDQAKKKNKKQNKKRNPKQTKPDTGNKNSGQSLKEKKQKKRANKKVENGLLKICRKRGEQEEWKDGCEGEERNNVIYWMVISSEEIKWELLNSGCVSQVTLLKANGDKSEEWNGSVASEKTKIVSVGNELITLQVCNVDNNINLEPPKVA